MKKILKYITGFSLYIFLSFNFCAKLSLNIGTENTKWDFPWCNLDQASITEQITELDTIIDGVEYKKVGTLNSGSISYDLNVIGSNGYARRFS